MRFLTLLMVFTSFLSLGQHGYKIDFRVKGLKDTTAYLGFYLWENTYIKDTARVNGQGVFSFEGKDPLTQGIYFLVLNKVRMFEFIVSADQHFSFETSTEDYVGGMKVAGDEDNRLFFENMFFNVERHKEAEPYIKIIQDSTLTEDQKKDAREAFNKVNEKVVAHQNDIVAKYPEFLTSRIFKMSKAIAIPDPPKKADGSIDSTFQYRYYKAHYFDYFDLSDEALTRMPRPFYKEKVNEYLDKMCFPHPDSLTNDIIKLAHKAKRNQETYKYLVWLGLIKYQAPEIMGLDEVYVKLYDLYFESKEMDFWVSDKIKSNLKEHADKIRMSMIGRVAPNLIMQDQNLQPRSMYDLKHKYTLIFFFDPDCGHCREETPKLVTFYNKNKSKFDIEIFAVSADTSIQKMKDYIKEMKMTWITVNGPRSYVGAYHKIYDAFQTPTIYILDEKKKIIGKKLPIDRVENFLINYELMQKKKAAKGT